MISFRIALNEKEVTKIATQVAIDELLYQPLGQVVGRWRFALVSQLQKELTGGTLKVRSGQLVKDVRVNDVSRRGDSFSVDIAATLPYARIHENPNDDERVIRPKRAQFLTVPIPHNYTGKHPKPLASYPEKKTFMKPSTKGGQLGYVVFLKKKPRSASIPIYYLTKQVVIPRRPYISNAIEKVLPKLSQIVTNIIVKQRPS